MRHLLLTDIQSLNKIYLNMKTELQSLHAYGQSLVGKMAQCSILTMITAAGTMAMQPAQKITGYRVSTWSGEPVLLVTIDGNEVFEDTLRNIK
jgi:hypothetical protein